jgi:hypothetical protein
MTENNKNFTTYEGYTLQEVLLLDDDLYKNM